VSAPRAVLLTAAVSLSTFFVCARADAYCRTKACDTEPSYGDVWDEEPQPTECMRNAQGCYIQGTPLYWPSTCISFAVQSAGSKTSAIDFDTANDIIEAAFLKWAIVDCGGAQPSFSFVNKGAVDCHKAEYNQESGNANLFMFRDDSWPYMNQLDTLALTTLTYNVESAEIFDADVEINTADATFTTVDDPGPEDADLEAVVTHEIGHFLGLAHSEVNAATMRAIGYELGTTGLRTLAGDDIQGICEIYPPGEKIGTQCTPRHGFSRECGTTDDGCTFASGASKRGAEGAFAALVGLGLLGRRVLRRARPVAVKA
jgi:hypothetical protein